MSSNLSYRCWLSAGYPEPRTPGCGHFWWILEYQLSVIKGEKNYQLAQKEFYLLYKLLSTPNTIFTRQELMEEIWGLENESDFRTVDVHIKRIREKLEEITEFEIIKYSIKIFYYCFKVYLFCLFLKT